jgi:glycine betaine/proline transport system substrate-binding protein
MAIRSCLAALGLVLSLTSGALAAADPPQCRTVRIGDGGWTDNIAQNGLAMVVLKALGYEPTTTLLSYAVVLESLKNKQIDVFLDHWSPSVDSMVEPYLKENAFEKLNTNLTGAKYTLAVPAYVWEAGLRDFKDIAPHKDKLSGKIYGIESGSDANIIVQKMIDGDAFGLKGFELVESSEQAMLSQVERAEKNKEWIVFVGWAPHPMNVKHDMRYLSGGDEYFGPDYGGATVYTTVRTGLSSECPNLYRFFQNLAFTVEMENELMTAILDQGQDGETAARAWLKEHPEVLAKWLEGVAGLDGQPAEPAVRQSLGV